MGDTKENVPSKQKAYAHMHSQRQWRHPQDMYSSKPNEVSKLKEGSSNYQKLSFFLNKKLTQIRNCSQREKKWFYFCCCCFANK